MTTTCWIASYPRSGNTWVRMFLASLLSGARAPLDFNSSGLSTPIASSRALFDRVVGLPSAWLPETEVEALRPDVDRALAARTSDPTLFRKVHDAYRRLPDGRALLGEGADFRAVYIVREPWDVAVSMSHFFGMTLDQAVAFMDDTNASLASNPRGLPPQLPQRLGRWNHHVRGWLDAQMPKCVLRYEALRAAPVDGFMALVSFLGLPADQETVARAIERCDFEVLRQQEQRQRFRETGPRANVFFRGGRVGEGHEQLSPVQMERLHRLWDDVERALPA